MTHALPTRLPRVLGGRGAQAAAAGLLVALSTVAVVGVSQRDVWGMPDRDVTVVSLVVTGRVHHEGKARCPEVRAYVNGPGVPQATFEDCAGEYLIGERVVVRQYRGDPDRALVDPLAPADVGLLSLALGLTGGLGVSALPLLARVRNRLLRRRRRS